MGAKLWRLDCHPLLRMRNVPSADTAVKADDRLRHDAAAGDLVREDELEITKTNDPAALTVQFLQRQLANSLVLFLNYKTCGWQCSGRSFGELERLFREFAEENKRRFDELGDRLRMIGQDPELHLESLPESSGVKQILSGGGNEELFAAAGENAIVVIRELRDQVRSLAREQEDPGSIHLLIDVLRMHECHEWKLRQLLKSPSDQPSSAEVRERGVREKAARNQAQEPAHAH
jgi:DNA-binding ferritin-like protein